MAWGLLGVQPVFRELGDMLYRSVFALVFVLVITLTLTWLCDGVYKQTSSNHSSS